MKKSMLFLLAALLVGSFFSSGCNNFPTSASGKGPKVELAKVENGSAYFALPDLTKGQRIKAVTQKKDGSTIKEVLSDGSSLVLTPEVFSNAYRVSFYLMGDNNQSMELTSQQVLFISTATPSLDTVGTVDIPIGFVGVAKPGLEIADPCKAEWGDCTISADCYGQQFSIHRSAAEETYRVTITGVNRAGTARSITFFVLVDAAGASRIVASDVIACATATAGHFTQAGRFTVYDNGDFAISINTMSSVTNVPTGIFIKPMKNITGIRVEKMGGCS